MSDTPKFSVQKVAELARIKISELDTEALQRELTSILDFVQQINGIDLTDIEPFYGIGDQHAAALRDDIVAESLDRQDALANAPDSDGEFYLVPPVFGKTD